MGSLFKIVKPYNNKSPLQIFLIVISHFWSDAFQDPCYEQWGKTDLIIIFLNNKYYNFFSEFKDFIMEKRPLNNGLSLLFKS